MPKIENGASMTEKERMQMMAIPQLGNVAKAFIRVTENPAFKVSMLGIVNEMH